MTIAVLDACVLYPPSLRDLLMRLASNGIYAPRWTDAIQTEWVRNVLSDNPAISRAQLERTCRLMEQVDRNSVLSGYEIHIPNLRLPDPDDRHVLGAAVHASASLIITYNISDFPACQLFSKSQADHPDLFLSALRLSGWAYPLQTSQPINHKVSSMIFWPEFFVG
jgi:hypothetical protein